MENKSTVLKDVLKFSQKYWRESEARQSEEELEANL